MNRLSSFVVPFLLTVLLLSVSGCDRPSADSPELSSAGGSLVGNPAPDIATVDMQGNKVTLSQYRGKVVILNFWATWCPPCREEMPSMEALHKALSDKGLVMLAVNVEENGKDAVGEFLKKTPYSFPILLDEDAAIQNTYKVFRFPESFIIDKNGVVVEKIIGGRDWMRGTTFKTIDFLLNG